MGGALQSVGAAMHNFSSKHSTAVGHTRYSAAPAQPYNFDAAPIQQYSPRVSPHQLADLAGTTHELAGLTYEPASASTEK